MEEYMEKTFSLEGHVGIVTGASRGIGLGIATVLTKAGAKVYNFSRSPRKEGGEDTGNLQDVMVDITQEEACKEALRQVILKEGRLDFLINNAGRTKKERAENFKKEDIRDIYRLNLEAMFSLCQLCYPYLKESPYVGRIVNIASMAAYLGFQGVAPYGMTKAGVVGLTKGLAEEWRKEPILVNAVAPGWVLTKMNEEMFAANPDRKEAALHKIMLDRFGTPEEVGKMIWFLLSEASLYLTGQEFAVDGGVLSHGY